jgi:hydrogenase/urease accessory protein HupE
MSRRALVAMLAGAVAGGAAPAAEAHLINTDLGPFYGGLVHPLTALEHLLPLVALGLLAGQQGTTAARRTLVLLPIGLAGGAGLSYPPTGTGIEVLNLLSLLVLGLLVAANRHLPTGVTEGLSLIVGVAPGASNGAAAAGVSRELFVVGLLTAGVMMATIIPALVLSLRATWGGVAVRVVGSWIGAVGLLLCSLALRTAR